MSPVWNPWHGCKKYSEGCLNCYVYRRDASVGRDAALVSPTKDFDLLLRRRRDGGFAFPIFFHAERAHRVEDRNDGYADVGKYRRPHIRDAEGAENEDERLDGKRK